MVECAIRKATRADIPELMIFQIKLAEETENLKLNADILRDGMTAMFDNPAKGEYYVAEIDNQIVGCHMVTYEWSDWRNGVVYWLQSVYVREDYRKHGVFRKMFLNLMNEIRSNPSIAGLRLYVDKTNIRAQQVYAAMGMNGEHYTVFEWMKS
ncbi:MAG TPA: GNAT family N-acetyltransferase [Chryseosolibacter sp.]|nr:GNAT family N-acetyltransferase [Chryseosolibacter sp.]